MVSSSTLPKAPLAYFVTRWSGLTGIIFPFAHPVTSYLSPRISTTSGPGMCEVVWCAK